MSVPVRSEDAYTSGFDFLGAEDVTGADFTVEITPLVKARAEGIPTWAAVGLGAIALGAAIAIAARE